MKDEDASALLKKGWEKILEGDFESARRTAKEVLAFFPSEPEALTLLGRALKELGALDEALALFERAAKIEPDYFEAALSAVETHLDYSRDFKEAARIASGIIDSRVKGKEEVEAVSLARIMRADAMLNMGKAEEAMEDLDSISGPMHLRSDYMQLRSRVLFETGRLDEAFIELTDLIEREEGNPENHYALALVHLKRGEEEEAVWEFQRVLELESMAQSPNSSKLSVEEFENLADRVIESLPDELSKKLGNVDIVVQGRPTPELVEDGVDPRAPGFFEQHEIEGGDVKGEVRVILFKDNLESYCRSISELEREIWNTIVREAEYFLGIQDEQPEHGHDRPGIV
ncbi:MAG: tetratricopeptide repeat protein [Deltaproteobacteria bacterium]|nr:tetratricopeptide repeat protein [Deltaproteobacteria bacterium]